ncbi:MAG TPA: SurA N-terminal domain-containing protein [Jiangellaceae bacterium]|jgi:hypothetical protein|nr:SurA N-terminal domain-containing protein [Jiangellaceae bacterium]
MLSRRVAAVASSAALAFVLTACDADQVGAAAVVGGDRITVSELQDHVREVVAMMPDADATGDQRDTQLTVLNRMIGFQLRDHIAANAGITVTEAEVDEFIAEQLIPQAPDGDLTPLLAQNLLTEETLREAVREVIVLQRVGGQEAYVQALIEASEEVGVEVNPRYGSWAGAGIEDVSGSVSEQAGLDQEQPPADQPDQ